MDRGSDRGSNLRDHPGIHKEPAGKSQTLKHDERDRADEAADRIGDGLAAASRLESFILNLDNFLNVLSDARRCSGLCWFTHA